MTIKDFPTSRWLEELSDDILLSISRIIYFFGSSVSGSILAIEIYSNLNPTKDNPTPEFWFWLGLSAIFGFGAFLYGCSTSYTFKYKKDITKSCPNKSKQADTDKTGADV
ncbi:hypothetical protein [Aeromonas sp. DNP9]|uniref:hypothetical protein n=1 Tax=Aeromonas sp. DNP9 TaxID=1535548 RepID=UPI001112FFEF|nr:hypothetical protein [Aeromonas sp. DNP9]